MYSEAQTLLYLILFVGYRGEIRKSCEDPVDCYVSADMDVSEIFIFGYEKFQGKVSTSSNYSIGFTPRRQTYLIFN